MKNIITALSLFILIILLGACSQKGSGELKTTIRGSFPAFKDKSVTLSELDINNVIPIDTVKIADDGSFRFRFRRTGPGFYLIKVDNKNYLTLILDKEKKVEVSSDQPVLRKSYTVKGSADSELYRDFEMFLETNRGKVDSLTRVYNDYQKSSSFRYMKLDLDKTYQDIFSYQRQYSITFLENHCASLASLLVIGKRFGERKILSEETDLNYFMLVDSCLSAIYPDNKYLAEFKKRIGVFIEKQKINEMTEKRLSIGNKVPDISMKDPSGKKVSLYSLQGRPVIIYFWASWNEDSRNANVRMKELLEKSGRDKPAVYAIGLETYKESWTDAINKDGTGNWIHVSDFLNIHSSAKSLFNAPDNLPYFILLDKELIIRYKGNDFEALGAEISRMKQ